MQVTIRPAIPQDATRINELLYQVAKVHADGRPDIFKPAAKKYTDEELIGIMECDTTPIFVAVNETNVVMGYAFCVDKTIRDHTLFLDKKTLYIDDICVDEKARGQHIGRQIFAHIDKYAKENEYDSITLNVWAFNEGAYKFYENCGMNPQRIMMEKSI